MEAMAIKKRRSFGDFMDEYFEDFEREFERRRESMLDVPSWDEKTCAMRPLSDLKVMATEVVMTVDLPLTVESSVQVKPLDERTLEISAEMKRKIKFKELGITHRKGEFHKLHCHKQVPVPVQMDKMHVSIKKGLLEIHIPRKRKR
jgi:HSP20 family molecular chaperone IbpA